MNEENEKLRDRLKSTEQKTSAFLEEKSHMREQLEKMQATMKTRGSRGVRDTELCAHVCEGRGEEGVRRTTVKTATDGMKSSLEATCTYAALLTHSYQGDTSELEAQLKQLKIDMEKVGGIIKWYHKI